MPGYLPGDTVANNVAGNPSAGRFVIMDPLSGPKGAPLAGADDQGAGGLSTGIGYGSPPIIGPTAPASILAAGFDDNQIPGTVQAQGFAGQAQNTVDSRMMYIGGGRTEPNPVPANAPSIPFSPDPYTAGIAIIGAGNGGSRDSGANTGFDVKTVTATGAVANGAAVEAGWINRSGVALVSGQSVFGSDVAGLAAPA